MSDSVKERLARIETECQATRRDIHAIFELYNNRISPELAKANGIEPRVKNIEESMKSHESGHWKPYLAISALLVAMGTFFTFGQKIGNFIRGIFVHS